MTGRADEIRAVTSEIGKLLYEFLFRLLDYCRFKTPYFDIGLHIDSILKEEKKFILQETLMFGAVKL